MSKIAVAGAANKAEDIALSAGWEKITQLSPHTFIAAETEGPLVIKIAPVAQSNRLTAEENMLHMLACHGVPVATIVEKDQDDLWRWTVLEPSGPSLARAANASRFTAAGQVLSRMHKLKYSEKGCFRQNLTVAAANLFSRGEFKTILSVLHERDLIQRDALM